MTLLVYPELANGALVQYPLSVERRFRTTWLETRGGVVWRSEDPVARTIAWRLAYRGLSEAEAQSLWDVHTAACGRLRPFLFVDPTANLLRWSNELGNEVWRSHGVVLSRQGDAWRAVRATQGSAELVQSLAVPAGRTWCLSARVEPAACIFLRAGNTRVERSIAGPGFVSSRLDAEADAIEVGIVVPAGGVTISNLQVEAQPSPSAYKECWAQPGIYPETRFTHDRLVITAHGPEDYRTDVQLISSI